MFIASLAAARRCVLIAETRLSVLGKDAEAIAGTVLPVRLTAGEGAAA